MAADIMATSTAEPTFFHSIRLAAWFARASLIMRTISLRSAQFFAWYKDNYKEQKQTSFVEGLKLKANHFVNSKMGSTANMEAKRILLSNEMKDVITIAKVSERSKRAL